MPEPPSLGDAWAATQERLPEGWTLDSLRCASTGLAEGQRSEDWIASAIGPDAKERTGRAADPFAALDALAVSPTS
jgi:hypothetical protein